MKKIILYLFAVLLISGCKGKKSGQDPQPALAPGQASLLFPEQNALCTSGTVTADGQSTITFRWNAAANAQSYNLTIKNLLTGVESTQPVNQTQLALTLPRNAPFSWYVTSRSDNSTATAKSAAWRFYNSGPGITNYAPYPADNLLPGANQAVTRILGKITLSWKGADTDNDIVDYDIYLGTASKPSLLKAHVMASTLADVDVLPATKYFWKVVTRDSMGNLSESDLVQFMTN